MEGDGLRAEGEFLVLYGLCREQLRFRLLDFILDGYLCVKICENRGLVST